MEVSWRTFKGLRQLNEFIVSDEHRNKWGVIEYTNGRPDHVINVQVLPDGKLMLFYWARVNDWNKDDLDNLNEK